MINRILLLYVLSLFLQTSVYADDCSAPVFASDFSDSSAWELSGNASINKLDKKHVLHISSNSFWDSKALVNIRRKHSKEKFFIVKMMVKADKIIQRKSKYDVAKVIIETGHKKIRKVMRFSGTFDWQSKFFVVKAPDKSENITLSLKNDALSGEIYFKNIEFYVCANKDQLQQFDYPHGWAAQINPSKVITADLKSSRLKWNVLNKDIYGVNSSHPYMNVEYIDVLNLQAMQDLKLNIVRFPGGARANYYHWKYDGYNPKELRQFGIYKSAWSRKLFNNYSRGKKERGLDDFAQWAKANNVSSALVLNVITMNSLDEPVNFIKHAKKQGLNVKYVELGNELYFKGQRGGSITSAEDYVETVRPLIGLIRKKFPGIKIGVPIFHGKNVWNTTLKNADLDIDAIIPHAYAHTSSISTTTGDEILFDYAKYDIPSLFDLLKTMFPGKKIWMSEWNFQDKPNYRRVNSLASVIYMADYLISMVREPLLEYAGYHSLFSKPFGLMEISDEEKFPDSVVLKYPYFFWKEIGVLFHASSFTSHNLVLENITEGGGEYVSNNIRIQAFKGNDKKYLLVVNDGAIALNLNMSKFSSGIKIVKTFSGEFDMDSVRLKYGDRSPVMISEQHGVISVPALSVVLIGPIGI
ncbi:MAG: hypothetical protein QM500_21520 [Methylococcales bacterium]